MIWLTWRQCRTQFVAVYGLVAAACVWLAVTGPALARLARRNENVYDLLTSNDRLLFNGGIAVLAVAPAVIGIFWGAPLVARELETGTYRLAWNQSVTRGRWLAVKLGFAVLSTAVAVGHSHPGDHLVGAADRRRHRQSARKPGLASDPDLVRHARHRAGGLRRVRPSAGDADRAARPAVRTGDGSDPGRLRRRTDRRAVVGPPASGPCDHDVDGHLPQHPRRHRPRWLGHHHDHHPRRAGRLGPEPTRPSMPEGRATALPSWFSACLPPPPARRTAERQGGGESGPRDAGCVLGEAHRRGLPATTSCTNHVTTSGPCNGPRPASTSPPPSCSAGSRSGGRAAGCPDRRRSAGASVSRTTKDPLNVRRSGMEEGLPLPGRSGGIAAVTPVRVRSGLPTASGCGAAGASRRS